MDAPLRTELDPQVREAVRELNRVPSPPQVPIEEFRAAKQRRFRERRHRPPAVASVTDYTVPREGGDVPVRAYRPRPGGELPAVVWLHGGGWAHGNMDMTDTTARWLATEVGCAVVSVEYSLSPEHEFPRALEETYAVLEWLARHPGPVGVDPDRVAVGGTSAGANLGAAVSLLTRDRDGPPVAFQVLAVPVTDLSALDTRSYRENAEGYGLTREGMAFYRDAYLRDGTDAHNAYASPLLARDHSGLPPALVLTAGFDPLRDEGIAYAERLAGAGVPVEHVHYPELSHYVRQHRNRGLDRGVEAFAAAARALREGLAA